MQVGFAVITALMITEPKLRDKREERHMCNYILMTAFDSKLEYANSTDMYQVWKL